MITFQLAFLWIVFVHGRVLLPSLPWIILLLVLGMSLLFGNTVSTPRKYVLGLIVTLFLLVNGVYSIDISSRDGFMKTVAHAQALRALGGTDEDIVMAHGPAFAVEFNSTNPLKTVEIPYGSIEQVEEIAARKNVRFIVVSDTVRSHWPIARLFDKDIEAPSNWTLLKEFDYREELWPGGVKVGERQRIYERIAVQ